MVKITKKEKLDYYEFLLVDWSSQDSPIESTFVSEQLYGLWGVGCSHEREIRGEE